MMNESVSIITPDHVMLELELAGLGSRLCAHLIDLLMIGLLILVAALCFILTGVTPLGGGSFLGSHELDWIGSWAAAFFIFLVFAIMWGYYVVFEGLLMPGRTPGKRRIGIRVVRDDGLPIGLPEAALRNLVRAADALPPPSYLLGGLVMHFNPQGKRLGDMVAGTLVVREQFEGLAEGRTGAAWAERVEQGLSRRPLTLPHGAITARQMEVIDRFLARRHELPPDRRAALAWQIISPLLPLMGEDPDIWARRPNKCAEAEQRLVELQARAQSGPRSGTSTPSPAASDETATPKRLF